MNILICAGTRPEIIKIRPLLTEFKKREIPFKTCFTGQHETLCNQFISDFIIKQKPKTDNRLNDTLSNCLEFYHSSVKFTHVLVQGDTSSALAMALWSFNRQIKIIHLEAGLRTYDFSHPFPEEANRQIISRLADIHFCVTENNKNNLISEKCHGNFHVVGNTVLDNLVGIKPTYGNTVLITLHRRENHEIISDWFQTIDEIAGRYSNLNFILPIHPNPNVIKHKNILKNVKVVDPLEYDDTIQILKDCKLTITDSGGIQEEATFLNKKIIICRKTTERAECIFSGHGVLCPHPDALNKIFESANNSFEITTNVCPFGDGNTSALICDILLEDNI